MQRQTFKVDSFKTLDWFNDSLIDWVLGGKLFTLDGKESKMEQYFSYNFDTAISSENGQYAFIYKRLGTKGLLLKNGQIIREINRSYYCADVYEYPAAFITLSNGRSYLVHCPLDYCRLDFEDVETGEIITKTQDRDPTDVFHSRLEISPCNKYLLSKGWVWHPWDVVLIFDINACLKNPHLLDQNNFMPAFNTEICTASFCNENTVIFGASEEPTMDDDKTDLLPPGHIALWDISSQNLSRSIKVKGEFGNLIAIDENYAWDLYKFPKIINLTSGIVEEQCEEISTGTQKSSIIRSLEGIPHIALNRTLNKLAILSSNQIDILSA